MGVGGQGPGKGRSGGGSGCILKFSGEPGIPPYPWNTCQVPQSSPCLQERAGKGSRVGALPEHIVMAVYLLAHMGVVQDAPVAHHGTGDALRAPGREAGQEQLLLGHWREARHHLLHHWDEEGVPSEPRAGQQHSHRLPQACWPQPPSGEDLQE